MSRDVRDIICDIGEMLDTVENECINLIEDRDDLQEKIKDLDEKEKEFPKAYDLGFEEGFAKGERSMQEKAKKIVDFWDEADDEEIEDAFSDMEEYGSAFNNINESYNKIMEYEKKKEQEERIQPISVGDELVGAYGFKYVVTKLDGKEVCLVDNHGDVRHTFLDHEAFTKTGKHYPLEEILKELER